MTKADYKYTYAHINGNRTAIVVDLDEGGVSVTNDIENIADQLFVDHIIYLDSEDIWTYWGRERGFGSLYVKDQSGRMTPTPTVDIAIEIAKARYIKEEDANGGNR